MTRSKGRSDGRSSKGIRVPNIPFYIVSITDGSTSWIQ